MKSYLSKKGLFIGSIAIAGTVLLLFLLPRREINVKSQEFEVHGEWSPVNLDLVSDIAVIDSQLIIKGGTFRNKWKLDLVDKVEVRAVIPELSRVDSSVEPKWFLVESRYDESMMQHVFRNKESNREFTVELPRGTGRLHYLTFRLMEGTDLFVCAAGDWKVGPESYYCSFVYRPKHRY